MKRLWIVGILTLALNVDHAESARVQLEGLVTADPLPSGYELRRLDDVVQDGQTLASKLLLVKEGSASKVSITIEALRRDTRASRVAAFKAYINGTADVLGSAGFKAIEKAIPDPAKADFDRRQVANFQYVTPDGATLYVQIQVLFRDAGYNIIVMGSSREDLAVLAAWADSVQPAASRKTSAALIPEAPASLDKGGRPALLDLGAGDSLKLQLGSGVTAHAEPARDGEPATVTLRHEKGECEMRLQMRKSFATSNPQVQQMMVRAMAERMKAMAEEKLANSIEQRVTLKDLPGESCALVYFELTDKRESAGDGRYLLQGCGKLGEYDCEFMMLSSQQNPAAKTVMLNSLAGMALVKAE